MATREITVDRLPEAGSSLEVVLLADARFGSESDFGPRRPHRHDYHELVWTRCGSGRHLIDGEVSLVEPNTITLIGRGQVHVFERAIGLYGAIVRFGDELLPGDSVSVANPAWLVGSRAVRSVSVPVGEVGRLEAAIEMLAAETRRPPDSRSVGLQRYFLSALLLICAGAPCQVRRCSCLIGRRGWLDLDFLAIERRERRPVTRRAARRAERVALDRRRDGAIGGVGVRAGAQAYLGPRPGVGSRPAT
jgi:hypothetical protein